MKVITEERLMAILSRNDIPEAIENQLINECQELETLTKRDGETALEKFRRMESECQDLIDETPIERLRFFVSLMCDINQDSQSWSDIEFLFDECTNNSTIPRYEPENV